MTNTPFQLYNQFHLGIIDDTIENCLQNFKKFLDKGSVETVAMTAIDFSAVCETRELEYSPTERKFLLYEPLLNPRKTVFFSNMVDGWYTAVYNYTRLFKKDVFFPGFAISKGRFEPAYFFRYFKSVNGEVEERTVYVMKENRWIFFESGTPLEIELTKNYSKKRKTERLNNEIIIGYLKKVGYDLTQESFYQTNKEAYLVKYT